MDERLNMQPRKQTMSEGWITICVASRSTRGDSTLLFCSGKIPPAVLSPALGLLAQEEHGPVRAGRCSKDWRTSPVKTG